MSSDLVERLREMTLYDECQEAADEIERLSALVEDTRLSLVERGQEVYRMRAALREIRDVARCSDGVDFYAMLAEKALEQNYE